jgi:hypothetical protein
MSQPLWKCLCSYTYKVMHKELKVPHDPAIPFLHAYPREMETHFTQKPVMNVYKYFIHNHPKLETT